MTFITKSYQNLFGVRSYINAIKFLCIIAIVKNKMVSFAH